MRNLCRTLSLVCLVLVSVCLLSSAVAASTLNLSTYKNNGYGWGNDIGGQWTYTAEVSSDVVFVEFYLDNALQLNATATPFQWQFYTADYPLGEHMIKAVAYDISGQTATAEKQTNFVEYSFEGALGIIVGVVIVVFVVSLAVLLFRVRRKAAKNHR